jgi:hypothetical protein
MRLATLVVAATAATWLCAGQGLAQTPPRPDPSATPKPPAAKAAASADSMKGHHTMDGRVTKVDAKRGWVDVKTPEGSMKLHFPPPALDNVKKGDSVTIDLGIASVTPATK